MSMLNYVDLLSQLSNSKDILLTRYGGNANTIYNGPSSTLTLEKFIPIYFTGDGHIITHGVDYTPDFSSSTRGLVAKSNNLTIEFLRGNNTWAPITTSDLPMAGSITDANANNLLSAKLVIDYVGGSFAANDALRFKGTIKVVDDKSYLINDGPTTQMPACTVGDTYRVGKSGKYAGIYCEAGDLLICISDCAETSENTSTNTYWTVAQTNINGSSEININNTVFHLYSTDSSKTATFFAPTTGGYALESNVPPQILVGNGLDKAPVWADLSSIIAGGLTTLAKQGLLTSVTAANGTVGVTVGGTEKTATASGTWAINVTGQAGRVSKSLTIGTGLTSEDASITTYNGSSAVTLNLLPATNATLGGVKVPAGILTVTNGSLGIDTEALYSAIRDKITGNITTVVATYKNVVGLSTSKTNVTTTDPYLNIIETVNNNTSIKSSILFKGVGMIILSTVDGELNFTVKEATSANYGGVKLGFENINKKYAVQLDNGKAFVEVPWQNTTYSFSSGTNGFTVTSGDGTETNINVIPSIAVVSKDANGLVPAIGNDASSTITTWTDDWVLTSTKGDVPTWRRLPGAAYNNTWRHIKVNSDDFLNNTPDSENFLDFLLGGKTTVSGKSGVITISSTWRDITIGGISIGDKTLNFVPTGDIYIKIDDTEDIILDISFGLNWYNINTKQYEIV